MRLGNPIWAWLLLPITAMLLAIIMPVFLRTREIAQRVICEVKINDISIALIAIWLGLSGFTLLFYSFNRHDFFFLNILGKQSMVKVTLVDPEIRTPKQVKLRKNSNLFLSLATHDIILPSICGGGGECGKCRVQFEASAAPEPNNIELAIVPRRLREQGWRLACQHEVSNNITLQLRKGTLAAD